MVLIVGLLSLFALAVATALLETSSARGFNPTAIVYIDAARHLSAGRGISTTVLFLDSVPRLPAPLSVWAPLYPVTIAGLSRLGLDAPVAARWSAILSFGLLVVVTGWVGSMLYGHRVAVVSALLVSVWPAMTRVAAEAWSESLFVLLLLVSVAFTVRSIGFGGSKGTWAALIGGLAMGAAALARYPGIPLIAVGAITLFLVSRERWETRLTRAVVWGVAAGIPPAVWLIRNLVMTGALIGAGRQRDDLGWVRNILHALRAIASDGLGLLARLLVVPEWMATSAERMMLGTLLVGGVLTAVLMRHGALRKAVGDALRVPLASAGARYVWAIGVGYWASMVIARSLISFYPLDSRLMMPAYPLVALGVVAAALTMIDKVWPVAGKHVPAVAAVVCLVVTSVLLLPRSLAAGGPRLSLPPAPPWVEWVATHTPSDALIVGNVTFEQNLYLRRPVLAFSSNRYGISRFDCGGLSRMLERLQVRRAFLLLRTERGRFDAQHMGALYGQVVEDLLNGASHLPLRPVARHAEFAVFEVLGTPWDCDRG